MTDSWRIKSGGTDSEQDEKRPVVQIEILDQKRCKRRLHDCKAAIERLEIVADLLGEKNGLGDKTPNYLPLMREAISDLKAELCLLEAVYDAERFTRNSNDPVKNS